MKNEKMHYNETSLGHTSASIRNLPIRERVGFSIEAKNAMDALKKVGEAESAGVRQVWMTVPGSGNVDTLTFFAAAVTQTNRIRLGTSILPVYTRHPLVVASQALAVNDLAPGRLRLGLGTSHRHIIEQVYGLSMETPLAYLKEYVAVLRGALWEGETNFHGKFFNVTTTLPRKAHIPLLVSALGVNAFRVAGEISDGVISWMCPTPYLLEKALPSFRSGAEALNRPIPPLIAHVQVALSDETSLTREAMRRKILFYMRSPFYLNMFSEAGFPVVNNESMLDRLGASLLLSGNEETLKPRLLELLVNGLDELLVAIVPILDEESERKRLLKLIGSL